MIHRRGGSVPDDRSRMTAANSGVTIAGSGRDASSLLRSCSTCCGSSIMSYVLRQELARRNRPSMMAPSSISSEHRTLLAAPDAETAIVAPRHAQRISCVLISDGQDCSGAYPKSHGSTHIGIVKLAACCGGRGRVAEWDDNACLPQLRRPPVSGQDHQPRSLAVVPLPAEPAHGRGDCWLR